MAKPNYAYEKRQRELEKKQKKENKALKKSPSPRESSSADTAEPGRPETPVANGSPSPT